MAARWAKKPGGGILRKCLPGFIMLLFLSFVAGSCGGEISMTKSKKKKSEETSEEGEKDILEGDKGMKIGKDYVYTSIGKRDPFRSPFDDMDEFNPLKPENQSILSPLQNYEVNSFSVKGIVWGISSPTAMVQAPDGNSYIVKTGTLIGRNWGKVVKIKRDSIVILEQSPLPGGGKVSNMIELKLPVRTIKPRDMEFDRGELLGEGTEEVTE